MSFGGQGNRLNTITVNGAAFNNAFGLGGGQPGGRTNVAPISLEAIEQIQVSIAPYDVRQGNFVGATVNTVTRSGTNSVRGSVYHRFRDEDFVGTEAGGKRLQSRYFQHQADGRVGGRPGGEEPAVRVRQLRERIGQAAAEHLPRQRRRRDRGRQRHPRAGVGPHPVERIPQEQLRHRVVRARDRQHPAEAHDGAHRRQPEQLRQDQLQLGDVYQFMLSFRDLFN
jgi:hypothetical protein